MDIKGTGSFLTKLRKEKDLTQKDLALLLGTSSKVISEWERGISTPDISLLDDLARILDTTILELLKGRKLEPEEIIENKDLIETMKYAALDTKNKFKRKLSKACVLIVCLCLVLLMFFNVKSFYYLNKTYYSANAYINEDLFGEVNAYVDIVLNNQGKYTDEEYEAIRDYVEAIRDFNDFVKTEKIFRQECYKHQEIKDYINDFSVYSIYGYKMDAQGSVYNIILKYDINKIKAMSLFLSTTNEVVNLVNDLYEFVEMPYYNEDTLNIDPADKLKTLIQCQFSSYKIALKDIIEVGGLNG